MNLPLNLKAVLAKIHHQNDLGCSVWCEVVYHDGESWKSYAGSKTFSGGESVSAWEYCHELMPDTPNDFKRIKDKLSKIEGDHSLKINNFISELKIKGTSFLMASFTDNHVSLSVMEKEYINLFYPKNNKDKWLSVNEELPSTKNGFIDELVLIRVRNKNKEDGVYIYDVCHFDGSSWGKRHHSWEDILDWKPIEE